MMIPGARAAGELEVRSPYDGALVGYVQTADGSTADRALNTARRLVDDRENWPTKPQRIRILQRTAGRMADEAESLAMLIVREGGKPLIDARVEVERAIDGIRLCVEAMRMQAGRMIPMGMNAASKGRLAFTQPEPIGPVLAFSAFNHPLNLIVHQVGPAIAAGCPIIIKPAEATPLSCLTLVRLLREAGLPDDWCQPIVVGDVDVAGRMVRDDRLGFFSWL